MQKRVEEKEGTEEDNMVGRKEASLMHERR